MHNATHSSVGPRAGGAQHWIDLVADDTTFRPWPGGTGPTTGTARIHGRTAALITSTGSPGRAGETTLALVDAVHRATEQRLPLITFASAVTPSGDDLTEQIAQSLLADAVSAHREQGLLIIVHRGLDGPTALAAPWSTLGHFTLTTEAGDSGPPTRRRPSDPAVDHIVAARQLRERIGLILDILADRGVTAVVSAPEAERSPTPPMTDVDRPDAGPTLTARLFARFAQGGLQPGTWRDSFTQAAFTRVAGTPCVVLACEGRPVELHGVPHYGPHRAVATAEDLGLPVVTVTGPARDGRAAPYSDEYTTWASRMLRVPVPTVAVIPEPAPASVVSSALVADRIVIWPGARPRPSPKSPQAVPNLPSSDRDHYVRVQGPSGHRSADTSLDRLLTATATALNAASSSFASERPDCRRRRARETFRSTAHHERRSMR